MENKDKKPYPWYDDQVTLLHEEAPAPPGWDDDDALSGDEVQSGAVTVSWQDGGLAVFGMIE